MTVTRISTVLLLIVEGCCTHPLPSPADYRRIELTAQIAAFEKGVEDGCVREGRVTYLSIIADAGVPAVDAMNAKLREQNSAFPPDDALIVIELAAARRLPLRGNPVFATLVDLASTSSVPRVRYHAARIVAQLQRR